MDDGLSSAYIISSVCCTVTHSYKHNAIRHVTYFNGCLYHNQHPLMQSRLCSPIKEARSPRVCGLALRHPRWTDQPYKEEHTSALQRTRFLFSPLRRKTGRIYISFASLLELKKKKSLCCYFFLFFIFSNFATLTLKL